MLEKTFFLRILRKIHFVDLKFIKNNVKNKRFQEENNNFVAEIRYRGEIFA